MSTCSCPRHVPPLQHQLKVVLAVQVDPLIRPLFTLEPLKNEGFRAELIVLGIWDV